MSRGLTISQVIARLKDIQKRYGDLEVYAKDTEIGSWDIEVIHAYDRNESDRFGGAPDYIAMLRFWIDRYDGEWAEGKRSEMELVPA
jgi:hypothetical protein